MRDLGPEPSGGREPARGLLRLILHFALYVWLQLLLSLFWSTEAAANSITSSNSSGGGGGEETQPVESSQVYSKISAQIILPANKTSHGPNILGLKHPTDQTTSMGIKHSRG